MDKCLGCNRKLDNKRYALMYCSEQCWYNDEAPNMVSIRRPKLVITLTKFGIIE